MILEGKDIKRILKERPNKLLVDNAQIYTKKLIMHMTGVGLDSYIERMEHFEKPELLAIRKKYTRSNKDMFSRLHRPIDKVWTARGGSVYYGVPDNQAKRLKAALSNVEHGYNIRKWLEVFWMAPYHYDPMGLIFMEIGNGETYPTYKSVNDVYDYQLSGRRVEYVVFKTDQKIDKVKAGQAIQLPVYRVVDDAFDYLVTWDGENYSVINKQTYPNYFQRVPATIISDIYDPIRGHYISPDDAIIEIADQYLKEGSVLNVFKNYFGFQQKWAYKAPCKSCQGTGYMGGEECRSCGGGGWQVTSDVSEIIGLPFPSNKEDAIVAPDVAGFIYPDVATWDKQDSSIEALYDLAYATKWNPDHKIKQNPVKNGGDQQQTATEVVFDEQPKIEALNKYADAAEDMEKFITDCIGNFLFNFTYPGADINYGRRYIIESPDQLLDKLQKLIQGGASAEITMDAAIDYYHSKFQGDSVQLSLALKLLQVEPLPFYTIVQAKAILPQDEYNKKVYYNFWRQEYTNDMLIGPSAKELRQQLADYTAQKIGANPIVDAATAATQVIQN